MSVLVKAKMCPCGSGKPQASCCPDDGMKKALEEQQGAMTHGRKQRTLQPAVLAMLESKGLSPKDVDPMTLSMLGHMYDTPDLFDERQTPPWDSGQSRIDRGVHPTDPTDLEGQPLPSSPDFFEGPETTLESRFGEAPVGPDTRFGKSFDSAWAFLKQEDPLGDALAASRGPQETPPTLQLPGMVNTADEPSRNDVDMATGGASAPNPFIPDSIKHGGPDSNMEMLARILGVDVDGVVPEYERLKDQFDSPEPPEPSNSVSEGPDWRDER